MKTKRFGAISILVVGLILVAGLGFLASSANPVVADSKSVVGSWNVHIAVKVQNASFPGLVTFASDGTILTDETPSPLETSGHGAWVKTKANEAAYTVVFLIGNADPGQWLKGTLRGTAIYKPKTDTWSGPFTITLMDQDGNEILSDTGTMDGTRISATP